MVRHQAPGYGFSYRTYMLMIFFKKKIVILLLAKQVVVSVAVVVDVVVGIENEHILILIFLLESYERFKLLLFSI